MKKRQDMKERVNSGLMGNRPNIADHTIEIESKVPRDAPFIDLS